MTQRPDYFVKSTEKTLAVLLAFNGGNPEMTVSQVAAATEQTRASARRFLLTLTDLGYLEANGANFRLTPRVLDLGASYLSGMTLPKAATLHLESLARELGESAALCVLEGQDILYIERVSSPRLYSMNVSIGNRLPAWVTSMGRVLIAELGAAEQEAFLAQIDLQRYTEHTVASLEDLRAELARVKEQGWSLVNQELDEGLRGLAVPVYRGDQLLGALNISVQRGRADRQSITEQLVPRLRRAAQDIADDFGGRLA
ncbi:IclR family transcriptional regulator domain-containing protein [Glutamicibacter protophormiae]|uniref:IclR family pca regulon transcriptional regulator n=1 Tax=Glutamicibacter protophormiae TaxID=37930 RepID=A0ABS4XLQ5_GLUPR|nr:IclR family transcriptional regulator C-terminal domain-containing protein [Glutamicibacter protophormiae]MBP2397325.1 IclR family pca regulon transcriptional regulator [Glutamicibacter protophormiae]WPR64137.1 IclR family transcriptional regulator C-terminal domain-containing protein [Glutamicibacter protophormiae]WPR67631.1 IclR family transcriptional regulator C-terminal domain-containing protein [Glutamicibacter protophormiae]GGL80092.1 IclR family transcriptional regulator [Glutamicibac